LYNAVANNGKMVKPLFVKEIQKTGHTIRSYKTEVMVEKICTDGTLKNLRTMLEGVVLRGTGSAFKNPNYTIAAKTGTALVADGRRGYAQKVYRSSFCGYFPADHPQYTCIVMVNGPSKGIYYGAAVAGPVFKEIADKVYANSTHLHPELRFTFNVDSALSIPKAHIGFKDEIKLVYDQLGISSHSKNDTIEEAGTEWAVIETDKKHVKLLSKNITKNVVPDVKGMGLKDALYLLENTGLKVTIEGLGRVKHQSILPGTRIAKGSSINLKLG
jgi:cell division protein FtsI (penicillin-binding protein 3)